MATPDMRIVRRSARSATAVVLACAAVVCAFGVSLATTRDAARQGQDSLDLRRIVEAAELGAGSVVAEIGAGKGELTVQVAGIVGDRGHVFSNEVNASRLEAIRARVRQAGLENVTVIAGREDSANLPRECCDAVFMNDVYHHFSAPAAMNASVFSALKPGGRLVILDFGPPPGAESADPARRGDDGRHGITLATLETELRAAGFEILSTEEYGSRSNMTVARRPSR